MGVGACGSVRVVIRLCMVSLRAQGKERGGGCKGDVGRGARGCAHGWM